MGPYDSALPNAAPSRSCCNGSSPCAAPVGKISDVDGLLAGAGYRVRSSDLCHVAQRLQRLESAMVSHAPEISYLASEAVHYNPSDLASWLESMLSQLDPLPPPPHDISPDFHDIAQLRYMDDVSLLDTWPPDSHQQLTPPVLPSALLDEEDSGIRLVHLLMTCADSVQRGDIATAGSLIEEMRLVLTRVNVTCGIGKVAGYFIDALTRRLFSPAQAACAGSSAAEDEILYHHFYEACPYLKFAHFTANQAILEAFDGHDCVHVIDFNLMHGLQWPALIQALALRPGGPPLLRLTGIGPPSPDGRDSLREIGLRLAEMARSVNVRFAFRGVAASRLDQVKPWMLQVGAREAVAVNSVLQLHRLLGPDDAAGSPIESVLSWIRGLRPKIVTVVEQEANHNQAEFLERFTEALYYYSTMFDSMEEACGVAQQAEKALAEMYLQREIRNVVCCEGAARVERHEPLARWRGRLVGAGFGPVHLGSNAFKQASMLLMHFSARGYCVEEKDGCLTLGWHSRPLIAASAWHAPDEDNRIQ